MCCLRSTEIKKNSCLRSTEIKTKLLPSFYRDKKHSCLRSTEMKNTCVRSTEIKKTLLPSFLRNRTRLHSFFRDRTRFHLFIWYWTHVHLIFRDSLCVWIIPFWNSTSYPIVNVHVCHKLDIYCFNKVCNKRGNLDVARLLAIAFII